jgi:hypothetical protein
MAKMREELESRRAREFGDQQQARKVVAQQAAVEKEPWYALYQKANQEFDALEGMHIWDRISRIEAPNMVYFISKGEDESRPRWFIVDQFKHGGYFQKGYRTRKAAHETLARLGFTEAPAKFFGGKW